MPEAPATLVVAAAIILAVGCRPRGEAPGSDVEALPQARTILGQAEPWRPLALEASSLNASMAERRKAGWATVERALQRIVVTNPQTGQPLRDAQGKELMIPLWQTWYELNEFRAMLDELWSRLSPEQKAARQADATLVDEVMRKHHEQKLLSKWTRPQPDGTTRFERLLSQLQLPEDLVALNGVSGQGYTLHSPELVRHYLMHYGDVVACQGHGADHTTGDETQDLATCFGGEPFPEGAASVKATWNSGGDGVAAFDTTAAGLARTFRQPKPTWQPYNRDALLHPPPHEIYSSYVFEDDRRGPTFELTGLHIVTKDIPEWLWVSLWWAPDPDSDFGEDRPKAISKLGPPGAEGVWGHYKMCVASTFIEGDPTIKRAAALLQGDALETSSDKSLSAALAAAYHFGQPGSYCSNPFIEFQRGVANTNCIGCHQHAGPYVSGAATHPDREQKRKSFMTDFLWSFESQRESFRGAIEEIIHE